MTLNEIAKELVAGCREGRTMENLDRLYAENAVSVEAADQGMGRETAGLEGIRGKHAWWDANMEMTGGSISDPMLHGDDRFAVIFEAQGRERASGNSFDMKEVAVYHVADGRIVREEFFYAT
ncbi:nuclear transport factor 2 family protein [Aestuariicoccus sp. MJ-SS9]|uniref:nuclear transport factor 2 family protein n=1 Tax=Aestuariicoccus sp. MJ-SS9 TaxID=3079855 RepID=UPI00290E84B4|nr:nuclear transport factor 2 family protein [Aestuariicoccus sp. MJ-SS9]MDU8910575.1 nuclear transport factor 2 family protein [Aestuariicoccus sp. MJ-SS9]